MPHQADIPLRDARDRVIDLLGFGETYPLRDLPILDEGLTVPFNTRAKIPIESSQIGVLYQLFDREKRPVKIGPSEDAIEAWGTGETLLLETPPVKEDVTYPVRAVKKHSGLSAYLHERATVKVGLDLKLKAEILSGERLEPGTDTPMLSDPRIVDYGTPVEVELKGGQEGVHYRLVVSKADGSELLFSETSVRGKGDGMPILLSGRAASEDVDLRIRATKTFETEEEQDDQSELLETILPLKVCANRALSLSMQPWVIAFKQNSALKIEGTQKSVVYQLFIKKIPDADFIHGESSQKDFIEVPIEGGPPVQLRAPESRGPWKTPEGFAAFGSPKSGTGGALQFALKGLSEDSVFLVQAKKSHRATPERTSFVSLAQSEALLVRPDPAAGLSFRVKLISPDLIGAIEVSGGTPGVFYHLKASSGGNDLARPAYFHKKDAQDARQNKGLGQLNIGVDFVVPRDFPQKPLQDPAKSFPPNPLLESANISLGSTLSVLALKAQSGIEQLLLKTADLPAIPEIAFESQVVDAGTSARLMVRSSRVGEKYTLTLEGKKVRTARNGNGRDVSLLTDPLSKTSVFEVVVTRPRDPGIPVERVLALKVEIR